MNHFRIRITLLAMLAAGILAFSLPLLAHPGPAGGERLERLIEHLDLDAEQIASVTALLEAHRENFAAIQWRDADGRRNPEARAQGREAGEALRAEIRALLTDEQAEKFDAMAKDRKRSQRRRFRDRR